MVAAIPSGVATCESEISGKILSDRITKGSPIFLGQIVDPEEHWKNVMAPVIPHKVISIEFSNAQELLKKNALEPGERISVFADGECLFQSVRVWEVDSEAGIVQVLVKDSADGYSGSRNLKAESFTLE